MSVPAIRSFTVVLLTTLVAAPGSATAAEPDEASVGVRWHGGGDPVQLPFPAAPGEPGRNETGSVTPPTDVPCVEPDQGQSRAPKLPRVIDWLYRWVRGFDIERSTTPAPQLYLRSPFLSGFGDPVGCPGERAQAVRPPTCVAVRASDGHEFQATYLVSLPQLGARTPRELATVLRERLDEGEPVLLRTLAGGIVRVDPRKALELDVRACDSEIV